MENNFDVGIIGGGIVGLATAYKYQKKYPQSRIAVFEKEGEIGQHQTGRNSGVIHSGIYYKPGSFKAKNCIDGRRQLIEFAKENKVDYELCGKVIVATNEAELPALNNIYQRGLENGIEDIELIGEEQIREIEPFCKGIKAIRVPGAGIINYTDFSKKLIDKIKDINPESQILMATEILNFSHEADRTILQSQHDSFNVNRALFCSGLQSDRMAQKGGANPGLRIVGFRGDYYELSEKGKEKVKHLIYPVPDPDFPFLGVHFTRMIDGSVECGPNAVLSFKREGYKRTSFNWKDTINALSFRGTWKLLGKHYKQAWQEYRRAFSKRRFLKALQKLIPDLQMDDIQPARAGVRAQALLASGSLVDDFKIVRKGKSVHVLNAPSPAATSCLAIADQIIEMMEDGTSK